MGATRLDEPAGVMRELASIEMDLAERQNKLESAATKWFHAKRDKEEARAVAFLRAAGTVAERQALADKETAIMAVGAEAMYEALKSVVRTLETRANICMSLLRAQSHV